MPTTIRYGQTIRVGHDHAIYTGRYIGPTRAVQPGQGVRVVIHGHITETLPYRAPRPLGC